jgi:hypothetical protein
MTPQWRKLGGPDFQGSGQCMLTSICPLCYHKITAQIISRARCMTLLSANLGRFVWQRDDLSPSMKYSTSKHEGATRPIRGRLCTTHNLRAHSHLTGQRGPSWHQSALTNLSRALLGFLSDVHLRRLRDCGTVPCRKPMPGRNLANLEPVLSLRRPQAAAVVDFSGRTSRTSSRFRTSATHKGITWRSQCFFLCRSDHQI